DAVVSNYPAQLELMTGNGNGTFQPPVVILPSGLSYPHLIAVGQFNNDTIPELAITGNSTIIFLLNNGTGTFSTSGTVPGGNYTRGITVNDFNEDGFDDIAFVGDIGGGVFLYNGSVVFSFYRASLFFF